MQERIQAAILGSFVADSLALGAHWVYDTKEIDSRYGRIETLLKPELTTYHQGKEAGDFTHYGDQNLLLLESVCQHKGFDPKAFIREWTEWFENYSGYKDKACKETLENINAGKPPEEIGSSSTDLGGIRIAPLLLHHHAKVETLFKTTLYQTMLTHNTMPTLICAEFFARVVHGVLEGDRPLDVIEELIDYIEDDQLRTLIVSAIDTQKDDTREAIKILGTSCPVQGAMPSTIHLIAKYGDDFREALIQNVMAGGDSAARGIIVGMILGAHLGMDAIPKHWLEKMKQYDHIQSLIRPHL